MDAGVAILCVAGIGVIVASCHGIDGHEGDSWGAEKKFLVHITVNGEGGGFLTC